MTMCFNHMLRRSRAAKARGDEQVSASEWVGRACVTNSSETAKINKYKCGQCGLWEGPSPHFPTKVRSDVFVVDSPTSSADEPEGLSLFLSVQGDACARSKESVRMSGQ